MNLYWKQNVKQNVKVPGSGKKRKRQCEIKNTVINTDIS